jgi:uncharacterized protein YvpB
MIKSKGGIMKSQPANYFLIVLYIILVVFLIIFSWLTLFSVRIIKIAPADGAEDISLDAEIKINFSGPINRNVLIPSIEPEIPGEWHYQDSLLKKHFFSTLVFEPQEIFQPKTKYKIKLQDIEGIFKINRFSDEFSFTTQDLPRVIGVETEDSHKIRVKLSRANLDLVDFDFEITPKVGFTKELSSSKEEYILSLKQELLPNIDYVFRAFGFFEIKDKETGEVIFSKDLELFESEVSANYDTEKLSFERNLNHFVSSAKAATSPPKIISYSPRGINKKITSKIKVGFSRPMNKNSVESNFYTSPRIAGGFSWSEDGRTVTFTPQENLSYGTLYKVVLRIYAKDIYGKRLPYSRHFLYYFQTFGRVKARIYPRYGALGVSVRSYIKVYFDQPVDPESAQEHFYTKPYLDGKFSFSPGNTSMYFVPNYPNYYRFSYGKTYRAYLSPGIKSVYGLDSNKSFSTKFTTQVRTRHLRVPLDFQDYPLSCEAAALRMALAYKGKWVGEKGIMNRVGIDWRPRNGNRWADPSRIFVGSLYGKQNRTGYGVYWKPIGRAARVWRPNSKAYCGMSINQLVTEVYRGNPVVVWGVYGNGYPDGWYSWGGRWIAAWKGEHARTVVGFIGSKNPRKIILNDPYAGKLYWSTSRFLANWNKFGRCGVVVR